MTLRRVLLATLFTLALFFSSSRAQDGYNVIEGTSAIDNLQGTSDNDWIDGKGGNDLLFGQDGDDVLIGGPGADSLDGGAGIDTAKYFGNTGVAVKLDGTPSSQGEAQGDVLVSIENVDGTVMGDAIEGNADDNVLRGFAGDDDIRGGVGADTLIGDEGDDTLTGGPGADDINGGIGVDQVRYSGDGVTVDLTNSANNAGGEAAGDIIVNVEKVRGTVNDDSITGDNNPNTLDGNEGNDVLIGNGGGDTLIGYRGQDTLNGGPGDDLLDPGRDADNVDGGTGIDTVTYSGEGVTIDLSDSANNAGGDAEGDVIANVENVDGTNSADSLTGTDTINVLRGMGGNDVIMGMGGADIIDGGSGDDTLDGGAGEDSLTGGPGADQIDGGANTDTVSYSGSAVTVDLSNSANNKGGDAQGDVIVNVENVEGTENNDVIIGDNGPNTLDGRGGNDRLDGKGGNNVYRGGAGVDTFVVNSYDTIYETVINDFQPANEIIELRGFSGYSSFSDIESLIVQNGVNVELFVADARIVIIETSADTLSAANFNFGAPIGDGGDGGDGGDPNDDKEVAYITVTITLTAAPLSTSTFCNNLADFWGIGRSKVSCTSPDGETVIVTVSRPSSSERNRVMDWANDPTKWDEFAQEAGVEILDVQAEEVFGDNDSGPASSIAAFWW